MELNLNGLDYNNMTNRERLVRTLKFLPVDRIPDYEFGVWEQTAERWHSEGLPAEYEGFFAAADYFKTDDKKKLYIGTNVGLCPYFEEKILEETATHIIKQEREGAVVEMMKPELGASIPRYLRYPIEKRKDWEKLRDERLDPDAAGRLPDSIEELCGRSFSSEEPVVISMGSLYGWIRNWMGVENASYALYDEPGLIEEIMEHLTLLTLSVLEKLAGRVRVDISEWWEDICFRSGPLLPPRFVAELMVPRYRRVTDFLRRELGCELNMLDCDGNIHELVSLWLAGGINVMFPLEAAHTDAYRISEEVGSRMAFRGYFNKLALISGKAAIDKEFERIMPLFKKGGFIPHADHLVPPDVSFENYTYYRKRKTELFGLGI